MYIWLMLKKYIILFFSVVFAMPFFAHDDSLKRIVTPHVSPALRFTENVGQWEDFIRYRMQLDGGYLYFEKDGLTGRIAVLGPTRMNYDRVVCALDYMSALLSHKK